jgi:iron(III) transport system ATP-binding protein
MGHRRCLISRPPTPILPHKGGGRKAFTGSSMPALVIEDVSCAFGGVVAVDRFSLTVEPGEFVTLLGPSGCGKTTTLRMVAGLERNTAGRISIGDIVASDPAAGVFLPPEQRQLGVVFQSYAIWPHMTVFENVAYPLRVRRRPAAEIREQVAAALRLVEMEAFADRPSPALSGGQQQRVAIARALVFAPRVLLLDEPLSNLDARLRTQMGDEFRALQRRLAITSLYVTHDQEEAMALSDRVVVMDRGRVLQIGSPESIYQRPASRAVAAFFGSPNLLDGRVTACRQLGENEYRLSVAGAGWQGECRASQAYGSGEAVIVLARPENIALKAGSEPGAITFAGKVQQKIFRGPRVSLKVATPDRVINMDASALSGFGVGDRIELAIAPASAWAIRP